MPNFLKKFLKQINVSKANYVFVITNFAGSGGNTLGSVRKILQKKKLITNAFGEITMPNNYVVMGNASTDSVARSILQTANQKIDQLREKISAKESLPFPKKNIFDKFFTSLIHPLFALTVQHTDKKFFSTDKCIGCGICEKVCPVNNITLNSDKKPLWLHKCEQCHACFHWCPSKAIEFNKKTYGKNRYTHPDISLKEMLA
jgi:ferredoxin